MKTDGRLTRWPLMGTLGDAVFAVLCARGHNFRKILAHLSQLFTLLIKAIMIVPESGHDRRTVAAAA